LPDWLKGFADKQLRGGSPFDDIKEIFRNKSNQKEAVEAKVEELRDRVGLDIIEKQASFAEDELFGGFGDELPDERYDSEQLNKGIEVELEHTSDPEIAKEIVKDHLEESDDYKNHDGGKYYDKLEEMEEEIEEDLAEEATINATLIEELVALANRLENKGKIKAAILIDSNIKRLADEITKEKSVFEKHPGVKKHIDNICESREGHIDAPALIQMIKNRPENLTDVELEEVKKYVKKQIKENKHEVETSSDDDVIGRGGGEANMDDEQNAEIFSTPSKV
jgi:hypothetical protein